MITFVYRLTFAKAFVYRKATITIHKEACDSLSSHKPFSESRFSFQRSQMATSGLINACRSLGSWSWRSQQQVSDCASPRLNRKVAV